MEFLAIGLILVGLILFLGKKKDMAEIKKGESPADKKFQTMLEVAQAFKEENNSLIGSYVDDFLKNFSKSSFYQDAAYYDDESRPWIYFLRYMGNNHHCWNEVEKFSRHYFAKHIPDKGLEPIGDQWETLFH